LYASDEDYRELLDRAEQRLRQTAIAVCESPVKEVVCDLTGGVDSRLTLASFLAIGQRRRVRVFCTAKYPRADRIVVDHLANKYGLRGATVALDNQLHDLSFEDKARRGVFRTFGLKL